jgi:hypothetical protein
VVAVRVAQLAAQNDGNRLTGRQAWPLLWASSRRLSAGVIAWAALSALVPPLAVTALGFVVGGIQGAVRDGLVTELAPTSCGA